MQRIITMKIVFNILKIFFLLCLLLTLMKMNLINTCEVGHQALHLEMYMSKGKNKLAIIIQAKHHTLPNYDIREFEGLAKAAGYSIIHFYSQNLKKVNSKFLIGIGKLDEIIENQSKDFAENLRILHSKIEKRREEDLVYLFMNRLKPNQIRNLSAALRTKVIDRDLLILDFTL